METPNLIYIDKLSDNDENFKKRLVNVLKNELPLEIERYSEFMFNENFQDAAEMVHKLKHKMTILGLEKSYYLSEKYEENLLNNSVNLELDFKKALIVMRNFVQEL